ncbi:MAG: zinc ribbon domain-containing protein [Ktedonobacteraceae bacterium]|nr:zinc ribbon domain-containing protein [Ktedonobacteraceae bacterium]
MVCPRCQAPLEPGALFCGNCGNQVVPINAFGATVVEPSRESPIGQDARRNPPSFAPEQAAGAQYPPSYQAQDQRSWSQYPPSHQAQNQQAWSVSTPPQVAGTRVTPHPSAPPSRPPRLGSKQIVSLAIVLVLVVAILATGVSILFNLRAGTGPGTGGANNGAGGKGQATAATSGAAPPGVQASISFSDAQNGQGLTNAVKVVATGLAAPPANSQYNAWLVNESDEHAVALGKLTQQNNAYVLNATAGTTNLLGAGNIVLITQEQGDASVPTGKQVLVGKFPPLAFVHIKHLLFSFPSTPNKIGLLVGLRDQARQLNAQALLLKNAAASNNTFAVQCAAQSMLNLVEGKNGQHTRQLPGDCTGLNVTVQNDGHGLLGKNSYIAESAAHAGLAAQSADATDTIKIHARHVAIATDNITNWVTTIDQDALTLLGGSSDQGKVQEIVTLADHTLNGVDLDHNETVDPVPGEAGTLTAYIHGQFMAQLTLTPAK